MEDDILNNSPTVMFRETPCASTDIRIHVGSLALRALLVCGYIYYYFWSSLQIYKT